MQREPFFNIPPDEKITGKPEMVIGKITPVFITSDIESEGNPSFHILCFGLRSKECD
jgi:hypothetical protein